MEKRERRLLVVATYCGCDNRGRYFACRISDGEIETYCGCCFRAAQGRAADWKWVRGWFEIERMRGW